MREKYAYSVYIVHIIYIYIYVCVYLDAASTIKYLYKWEHELKIWGITYMINGNILFFFKLFKRVLESHEESRYSFAFDMCIQHDITQPSQDTFSAL